MDSEVDLASPGVILGSTTKIPSRYLVSPGVILGKTTKMSRLVSGKSGCGPGE
jgi:hypothetical protein